MNFPKAYIEYLIQFHATRDFFECHELLEEYWKEHPNDGYSYQWLACIQLAVGQYHERRGNTRGATMMYQAALEKIEAADISLIGLNINALKEIVSNKITQLQHQVGYSAWDLPIEDEQLLQQCQRLAETRGYSWSKTVVDEQIVHRHKLRDRSEVIAAREASLKQKQQQRSNK